MDLILHIIGLSFIPLIMFILYRSAKEILKNFEQYFSFQEKVNLKYFLSYLEKKHISIRQKITQNERLHSSLH